MLSRLRSEKKGFTLIELIMVIVILGIVAAVAVPKFLSLADTAKLSAARGVGGALSSTIASKHADYLLNGTDYDSSGVITGTTYSGGITASDLTGAATSITLVYKGKTYKWTYTARSGDTSASITEDTASDF
jgi:MSHA pilin protein MshA